MTKPIDLHIHTTASDGTFSAKDVVSFSLAKGLKAIAITDHDTIDGIEEALVAGKELGLEVIPGVELSVEFPKGEMHILGYFIDHKSLSMQKNLKMLQEHRDARNPKVIEKLQDLGLKVSLEEAEAKAGGKVLGRPHIAAVLMDKGYVDSIQEAFDKYLAKGKPAYEPKEKLTPKEGIQLIKEGGGLAILAHPKHLGLEGEEIDRLISELVAFGLDGIEVYYTTHSPAEIESYEKLCQKYQLLATGGTDFHGNNKPDIKLGEGKGNLEVPYELVVKLKAAQ